MCCHGAGGDQRDTGALLHVPDKRLPRGDRASKLSQLWGGDKGPTEEAAVGAPRPSGHSITVGSDPVMLGEGQGCPVGLSSPEREQGEQPGGDR